MKGMPKLLFDNFFNLLEFS